MHFSDGSSDAGQWRARVCILGALHGMRVAADPKRIAPSDDSLRWAPIGHSEVPVNGRGAAAQLTALREIGRPSTGFLVSAYREASWPQSSSSCSGMVMARFMPPNLRDWHQFIRPSELVGIMDDTCCADSGTPA
jgi:hypothetical protein